MKNTVKHALINSLGASIYVVIIASFIYSLGNTFSETNDTIFAPIAMLMLFVFSAAFMSILVFGKPIIWYLDGKKKQAISLLFYTLGIFLIVTIVAFFLLITLLS
jgi:hypothetical protein